MSENKLPEEIVNQSSMRKPIIITLIIIIVFAFIVVKCEQAREKNISEAEKYVNTKTEEIESQLNSRSKSYSENYTKESIKSWLKNINKFKPITQDKLIVIETFKSWGEIISDAKKSKDEQLKKDAEKFLQITQKFQEKELPKLRMRYKSEMSEKLWENNIKVKISGKSNQIIEFVGVFFGDNKNIKDFQNEIRATLFDLRFKEVRYRILEDFDEFTYFTLNTKGDRDIFY